MLLFWNPVNQFPTGCESWQLHNPGAPVSLDENFFSVAFDQSGAKHALQHTENDCHRWLFDNWWRGGDALAVAPASSYRPDPVSRSYCSRRSQSTTVFNVEVGEAGRRITIGTSTEADSANQPPLTCWPLFTVTRSRADRIYFRPADIQCSSRKCTTVSRTARASMQTQNAPINFHIYMLHHCITQSMVY